MTDIKWQEPPTDGRIRGQWEKVAAALRGRPGEWALVRERADASQAIRIKRATIPAFSPAGSFEAVSRKREDGKFDVYARYVGEVSR